MVKIITDSTSDISILDQKKYDIEVAHLIVQFGDQEYLDGIEITNQEFYDKLSTCEKLPTTSQVNPERFYQMFKKHLDAGDSVVGIFISSDLSGTYQSACTARDMLLKEEVQPDQIFVLDSRSATSGITLLAVEAAKYRDLGLTAAEIMEQIKNLISRIRFFAVLDTLKYLQMGGRISVSAAVIGTLLGIKPVIEITGGKVIFHSKARGINSAFKRILKEIEADLPDLQHEVALAQANAPELIPKALEYFQKPLALKTWLVCDVGSVLGTYAGPNCLGIAYISKQP